MKTLNMTPELIGAQAAMLLKNDAKLAKDLKSRNEEDAKLYLAIASIYALYKANK